MSHTMSSKLNFMNSVRVPSPKQSVFDLTHDVKFSCNMGFLVPVMVTDLVPGDKIDVSTDSLIRFAPLVSPMYHRCNVTFHTWAVPYRILWDNWQDYITETKTLGLLPVHPKLAISNDPIDYTPLMDYLGIPKPVAGDSMPEEVSAFRFAAYQSIYSEFYRDENLVPEYDYKLVDGFQTTTVPDLLSIRKRAWQHDYFTSNLPFAQKGDPVNLPIDLKDIPVYRNVDPALLTPPSALTHIPTTESAPISGYFQQVENVVSPEPLVGSEYLYLKGDQVGNAATTTINDLRLAEQLQKYLERAARSGTRLVEWIKGMFGVTLPDYTAQRPQYIGGTIAPVQVSEVLNTTGESGGLPQGNMAGRALSSVSTKQGNYYAREHCVVMTLMSIMPESTYQQGLERQWLKFVDPKDYLNPMFANLGEQATLNREIMAYQPSGGDTFGYLPRYSEYRTIPSRVAGDFRDTLSYWTMSRIFAPQAMPALNQQFIECDATHRVFADTDPTDQKMYVHVLNRIRAVRPLPKYGTPSL